jgi:hypothetical protein
MLAGAPVHNHIGPGFSHMRLGIYLLASFFFLFRTKQSLPSKAD